MMFSCLSCACVPVEYILWHVRNKKNEEEVDVIHAECVDVRNVLGII